MITESIENDELQDMSEHILWGEARRLAFIVSSDGKRCHAGTCVDEAGRNPNTL